MHSVFYNLYSTPSLYTLYYVLSNLYYVLCALNAVLNLCMVNNILKGPTPNIVCSIFQTLYFTFCILESILRILYVIFYILYARPYILYFVLHLCTLYVKWWTLQSTPYSIYLVVYTLYSILPGVFQTLYTPYYVLSSVQPLPHIIYSILGVCTLYVINSTFYIVHSLLNTLHYTLYALCYVHCILHPIRITLHYTLYSFDSILYTLHYMIYNIHSTICIIYLDYVTSILHGELHITTLQEACIWSNSAAPNGFEQSNCLNGRRKPRYGTSS